ncbi:PxKF domain-containing protein [Deinococcus ficus]|uniref:PxKF domain-containing protein n=1 Tax=Deinococcus ficus TaxID=317577 RepID=UPI0013C37721|nr:PxKF domain-containing protein [Deinococcus ficus]
MTSEPITLAVGSTNASGDQILSFKPEVSNEGISQGKLEVNSSATVTVSFTTCAPPPPASTVLDNKAPVLTVPQDFSREATGRVTVVDFAEQLSAIDREEGNLTDKITCTPVSGSGFAVGATLVTCSVSDSGKRLRTDGSAGPDGEVLTTTASFTVTVEDNTAPDLTVPQGTVSIPAIDINGVSPDYSKWVSAWDLVDEEETPMPVCTPASLPIGLEQTVECTATDSRGNRSDPQSFTVNVTFASASRGLLQPVNDTRNGLPISLFKAGSTIPLKFLPPTFAGGDAATGLAGGLRLVVTTVPASGNSAEEETTDLSSGSTAWRYDLTAGQYVFNLSTKNPFFRAGMGYRAEISFQGVPVARGDFRLK